MAVYTGLMLKKAVFAFILVLESIVIADLLFFYLSKTPSDKLKAAAFHQISEPLYRPFRFLMKRLINNGKARYDISPFITLALCIYIQNLLF